MCGLFGVMNARKAAELTVVGLHSIQHRAVDYAGIVATDGRYMYRERGNGIVREVFTIEMLDRLHGKAAIGHTRYPTVADDKTRDNTQPIVGQFKGLPIAIAHNGNLTNASELSVARDALSTSMDSEYILRLIEAEDSGDIVEALSRVLPKLKGSYALLVLVPDRIIACRDPRGNRPLSLGRFAEKYFVSSETCSFPGVGATHVQDIRPGTITVIGPEGIDREVEFAKPDEKKCRFEGIYFSHPSSKVFGENVARFRMALGRELERLCPVEGGADIVMGVPDSATCIAMGYGESARSGKYFPGIFRSHYVGRTFIAATQAKRDAEVAQKFAFSEEEIAGKQVVVVDDSIVRGTTLPKIVKEIWRLGAKAVHVRIGSPPFKFPCTYGINTPTKEELISSSHSPAEIRAMVGADSLAFMPLDALKAISGSPEKYCFSCMTGEYW